VFVASALSSRIFALVVTFFAQPLINSNKLLVLQYLSARYAVSLSSATFFMVARSGMILMLYVIILPSIGKIITRRNPISTQRKDLDLARASHILWSLGWTLFGLVPSVALAMVSLTMTAMCQAAGLLTRSLLVSLLPQDHVARVNGVIGLFEAISNVVGSPVLAEAFAIGLSRAGWLIGLPFLLAGFMSAIAVVIMVSISV
jgi:hypothetical protein